MKSLLTLIKLHTRALDGLRRTLAEQERQKEKLEELQAYMEEALRKEIALASEQPEMSRFFGDYAKRMRERKEVVTAEIKKTVVAIEATRRQISDRYAELKKYEISLENQKKSAQEAQNKKEQAGLDDVALQGFARAREAT